MNDLVPKGWILGKLTDFSEINPKLNQPTALTEQLSVSFIKMEDVSNSARVVNKRLRKYIDVSKGFTKFNDHDVLVAKITPCFENGKGGYAEELINGVGFGSTEFHVLRAKSKADSKFLYHYSNYSSFRLDAEASMCGTGGQRRVQTDFLRTYKVVFPSLPEQQKIAKILTSVDEVIEKTQAQIDKLKDLKTGMMQELLTNGIGHTEFKDSPVGRIPAEWSVLKIADLCSHVVDCVNKTAPVVDFKTPYKMIRTTNVRHGRVDTENVRCVTKETFELWTRRLLPENGDLIFTREAPVGECGILKDSRGVFLGQRTMMYRANKAKTSAEFLMYSIMSDYGKQQLEDFSGGSTVGHMRVPDCGRILIKIPPIDEQAEIVKLLCSVDTSILVKEKKLAKINHLKKALMQDLLTGKVRVKVN